jgi:multidrug efflux pump subunit AcrB
MLRALFRNHVLANLITVLVLLGGFVSYQLMPREQDPEVNFNWVQVFSAYPGASAEDVEREVTSPLEDGIRRVGDIKFVSSTSREGISSILVRFGQIDAVTFDKRVADIRREIQNKYSAELPPAAQEPWLLEILSSNTFPTAALVLAGTADDELLRKTGENLRKDLERLPGVDRVDGVAWDKPELHVEFDAQRLQALSLSPADLADAVTAHFRDVAGGSTDVAADQEWLVRFQGRNADPEYIAQLPVSQARGVVPISEVAKVSRSTEKATQRVRFSGRPAKVLNVFKQGGISSVDLLDRLRRFIKERNPELRAQGMHLILADDQSERTVGALSVMETNAVYGLLLVFAITWLFLGWRLSLLVTSCIPVVLAGLFWLLHLIGFTLNTTVLLGVVIVLGMLVDDSVVIVDAINFHLQRGRSAISAAAKGIREIAVPVVTSSLTTVAAFLPLILLPGILGQFMKVIPTVVSIALAISLIEAMWLLPAHIVMFRISFDNPSRLHQLRLKASNWLINKYYAALLSVLKRPLIWGLAVILLIGSSFLLVYKGYVKTEFFADDPIRLFYVNVDMAPGTTLNTTLDTVEQVERIVRKHVQPAELRTITSVAGFVVTDKEPLFNTHIGQVMVSLLPATVEGRSVDQIIDSLRPAMQGVSGPLRISFLKRSSGPPVGKPIDIKVRGDDYRQLRAASTELEAFLSRLGPVRNLSDDDSPGKMELKLTPNTEALQRSGVSPALLARLIRLYVDGEIVGQLQDHGEKVGVRVLAAKQRAEEIDRLLQQPVALPGGGYIALGQLVKVEKIVGTGNIRHYNFRRTITIQGDLDKARMDTLQVNRLAKKKWEEIRGRYPGISLDFSGELDDIQESLDSLKLLLMVGVGLIYIILGAEFRSYWQPFIILVTIPLAFAGVIFGLFVSGNPISLYTLYGVVALTGIAVNSAIVLIDVANQRVAAGMDPLQAILVASKRRLLAIIITSASTIGGLLSLAAGWGGHSLLWSPMATAIVWGLVVSTLLTLFVVPLLFWATSSHKRPASSPGAGSA